ncbi:hypothetical protein J1614_011087 [Plenodomus biglobosus]|nr:hypothetical protein J1614_011087 [Plenodomus biglobosus]
MHCNVQPRRAMYLTKDQNAYSRGGQAANTATEEILVHNDCIAREICDAKTLEPKELLNYTDIDQELHGYGNCAHPPHDRKRGLIS